LASLLLLSKFKTILKKEVRRRGTITIEVIHKNRGKNRRENEEEEEEEKRRKRKKRIEEKKEEEEERGREERRRRRKKEEEKKRICGYLITEPLRVVPKVFK